MIDLLDEIKEDIEKQRLSELWKNYGKWVIFGAFFIIFITAATVWFQEYQLRTHKNYGSEFYKTINNFSQNQENTDLKDKAVDEVRSTSASDSPYALLSSLFYADYLLEEEQKHEAVRFLSSVSDINNKDIVNELITLLAVAHQSSLSDLTDNDLKTLTYLSRPDAPWKTFALEQLFIHAISLKDWAKAHEISSQISKDPSVLYSIKQRIADITYTLPPVESPVDPQPNIENP